MVKRAPHSHFRSPTPQQTHTSQHLTTLTKALSSSCFHFLNNSLRITLTYSKRNIPSREQAPTFPWRANWYVGVYGKVLDSVSVWHSESACRRPLHHVKRPHQSVWSESRLPAHPQVSLQARTSHTYTQWAQSLNWKHLISCTGFEQPRILAPYEEESK